jgi:hypothetical protein
MPIFSDGENTTFHADELICVTSGEYPSFSVNFVARVRKDFDAREYVDKNGYFEKSGYQTFIG